MLFYKDASNSVKIRVTVQNTNNSTVFNDLIKTIKRV